MVILLKELLEKLTHVTSLVGISLEVITQPFSQHNTYAVKECHIILRIKNYNVFFSEIKSKKDFKTKIKMYSFCRN